MSIITAFFSPYCCLSRFSPHPCLNIVCASIGDLCSFFILHYVRNFTVVVLVLLSSITLSMLHHHRHEIITHDTSDKYCSDRCNCRDLFL